MSAMVLPEPDLIVPDIFAARRNASLWEAYGGAAHDAASLLGPTRTRIASEHVRSADEGTFFEPARLLRADTSGLLARRLAEFERFPKRNTADNTRDLVNDAHTLVATNASIVIYEQQERDLLSDEEWATLVSALRAHQFASEGAVWVPFSPENGLGPSTELPQADGPGVLVLALGTRSGLTSQRMFLAGRQIWPSGSFRGLVVHAHPENARVWASMRNTFTDSEGHKRLLALWLTYMPVNSPLALERDTLEAARIRGLETPELLDRLNELQDGPDPQQTLLGRAGPLLEPHSYFGQGLGSRETMVAVGSAMQAARLQPRPGGQPYWAQFDLRRVFRSYFDGLIHACILRWCEPHEAWWGGTAGNCTDFLRELEGVDFDFDLLLPELLLAAAQEKLPEEAAAQLVLTAKTRAAGNRDARTAGHLALGIDLCELALEIGESE